MGRLGVWAVVLCGAFGLVSNVGAQVSPLNLSPGFPTQLDDAYPVNQHAVVIQPAIRFDKTASGDGRGRQTIDVRWGVGTGTELFVGGTGVRGPLEPGTMDDPRAIRAGLLYRFTRQQGPGGLEPSLAVRTTVQIPISGPGSNPALRAELLSSWDLTSGWFSHTNVGYQVVPGGQPGLQSPGVNGVWFMRSGFVKALWYDIGMVANVSYSQNPNQLGGYVLTPEVGFMWSIAQEWILTCGGGRDFGGGTTEATMRANLGISWVW